MKKIYAERECVCELNSKLNIFACKGSSTLIFSNTFFNICIRFNLFKFKLFFRLNSKQFNKHSRQNGNFELVFFLVLF